MSQTSYDMNQDTLVAGLISYAAGQAVTILSYNNPVDAIKFGRAVAKVAADENGIKKPTNGDVIVGVSVRDQTIEYDPNAENQYPPLSAVGVMRRGQIAVVVEEAVTPDDPVFVRHTANGPLTDLGAFRKDNDGGNAVALTTAVYLTAATAVGDDIYAIIDLNIA